MKKRYAILPCLVIGYLILGYLTFAVGSKALAAALFGLASMISFVTGISVGMFGDLISKLPH